MNNKKNRLKDLRTDKDLTQNEVAKLFYLQPTQYRRYENGDSDLTLEWAKRFARFYNVSIDYIAGLTDIPDASNNTLLNKSALSKKDIKLINAYHKNKEYQKAINKILDIGG